MFLRRGQGSILGVITYRYMVSKWFSFSFSSLNFCHMQCVLYEVESTAWEMLILESSYFCIADSFYFVGTRLSIIVLQISNVASFYLCIPFIELMNNFFYILSSQVGKILNACLYFWLGPLMYLQHPINSYFRKLIITSNDVALWGLFTIIIIRELALFLSCCCFTNLIINSYKCSADRYKKYPLYMWWSICWSWKDHFREVIICKYSFRLFQGI